MMSYVPLSAYVWPVGTDAPDPIVPSPKSHEYASASPSVSVAPIAMTTAEPSGPEYGPPTDATGSAFFTAATCPTATLSSSSAALGALNEKSNDFRYSPCLVRLTPKNFRPTVAAGT